ncbi:hypothetical protein CFC21_089326 [Triticum aestivum]|uniref:Uncharacterized protein n=3 Tax=Triticum TaxID=4564 RepID=A0A9R0YV64_TRITD|nr:uncharacterized protein LOC119325203 [Triticum dicoccoides]XP_044409727.1 uncharacterized protein LOC123134565 [Triticum aestivum]KAF7085967.1 hypothetical protein CFC21_089326 [Triticum aestivum]VAI61103.1 unnamed protein product [Triticum turgidum subsp. durum]
MAMGKKPSKVDGAACRRHWRQGAPGVCPLCLRERLSGLSTSASLPSVVARGEAASRSSCCSDSDSEASSTEASTGASSGSASPGFHREIRRAARPSLLMRHERVVTVDGDEAVLVMRRRRERPATSFWTKLLRAATGGKKAVDGCSLAHSKTIEAADRSSAAATKWIVF